MAIERHRSERLQRLAHILAAAVILLHGFGDLEHGHAMGWAYIAIGAAALCLGFAHHRLKTHFQSVDALFHLIEALMAVLIGISYLKAGKTYLPWVSMAAAIPYLVLAARSFRNGQDADRFSA